MICSFWHFIKSLAGLARHGTARASLRLAPTCEMLMRRGARQLVLWESLRWGRWRGGRRAAIMHFVLSAGRPYGALVIHSAAWLWAPRALRARGYLPSVPRVGHVLFLFRSENNLQFCYPAPGCALAGLDACLNMNSEAPLLPPAALERSEEVGATRCKNIYWIPSENVACLPSVRFYDFDLSLIKPDSFKSTL